MPAAFSNRLVERLKTARRVVVLTGAGVSAESGVPTFRDKDGLWDKFSPAELANFDAFMKNPELVWEWYHWRQTVIKDVRPNPGHVALAELEAWLTRKDHSFYLVTQNVDGLHRRAGSKCILELHGNILRNKCSVCNFKTDAIDLQLSEKLPTCPDCGKLLRPDVVWFGEMLPEFELGRAMEVASACDVCLSVGTSAVVYPAAFVPVNARNAGAYVAEINPEPSAISHTVDEVILGKSGEVLPHLVTAVTKAS